jgi:hypothetical protein
LDFVVFAAIFAAIFDAIFAAICAAIFAAIFVAIFAAIFAMFAEFASGIHYFSNDISRMYAAMLTTVRSHQL